MKGNPTPTEEQIEEAMASSNDDDDDVPNEGKGQAHSMVDSVKRSMTTTQGTRFNSYVHCCYSCVIVII